MSIHKRMKNPISRDMSVISTTSTLMERPMLRDLMQQAYEEEEARVRYLENKVQTHAARYHKLAVLNVKFQEVELSDFRPFLEFHSAANQDEEDGMQNSEYPLRENDELLGIIEGSDKMNDEVTTVLDMGAREFIVHMEESMKTMEEFIMIMRRIDDETRRFIYFKLIVELRHTETGHHEIVSVRCETLRASIFLEDDTIWDINPNVTSYPCYIKCSANGQYLTPHGLSEREHTLRLSSYHGNRGANGDITNILVIQDYQQRHIFEAFPRRKIVMFNPKDDSDGDAIVLGDTNAEGWMFKSTRIRGNVICLESLQLRGYYVKVSWNKLILHQGVDFQDPEFHFEIYPVMKIDGRGDADNTDKPVNIDNATFAVLSNISPTHTKPVENGNGLHNTSSGPIETDDNNTSTVPGSKSDTVSEPIENEDRKKDVDGGRPGIDETGLKPNQLSKKKRFNFKECLCCCWPSLRRRYSMN